MDWLARIARALGAQPPRSLSALLAPHVDHLYRLAFRFTGRREDAEDLVQNLVLRLHERRADLQRVDQLRPWLAKVMYRLFVDDQRRAGRQPSMVHDHDGLDRWADAAESPEQRTARVQLRRELDAALSALDPDQRILVALCDMEGYKLQEAAELLELPLGTVKSRLHRGRAALREQLASEPFRSAERVEQCTVQDP